MQWLVDPEVDIDFLARASIMAIRQNLATAPQKRTSARR